MRKILLLVICGALAIFIAALFITDSGNSSRGGFLSANTVDFNPAILADSSAKWQKVLSDMPEPTVKLPIKMRGYLRDVFNDSNTVHWASAERIGIKPLTDTRSFYNPGRDMVKVSSCKDFYLEELNYSAPYLVREGADALHEIGRRFNDSLQARGGGAYRIIVTSVLRTPDNVARLRRSNRNAVDSSVHQLGTTFDITYSRFACNDASKPRRSAEDLKNLLAEVLQAMRSEGKLWVKFERNQPCFHITARGKDD